jgi:hypothetical protein
MQKVVQQRLQHSPQGSSPKARKKANEGVAIVRAKMAAKSSFFMVGSLPEIPGWTVQPPS